MNPPTDGTTHERKSFLSEAYDWLEVFVMSVSVVFLVFTFIFRIAMVIGPSMEDTLHEGEALVISKLFYTPKTGDIIVFQMPDSHYSEPIVKRVIATEGQVVDIDFYNWIVTVDGIELQEDYVKRAAGEIMLMSSYSFPYTVPEGKIFVMGDNRNSSLDSRDSRIGPVDTRFLLGRVLLRLTPISKFGPVE
ncbi:MAG: signal peptidase I [Eubacteriales bacterium]|jgi:signal peptidase I|nr:signal peptidase I [Clostridiales bacterium]